MYSLWNNTKTTLLMGLLMGLALGVGYLIGGPQALIPALVIGGALNVFAFFFSDKIALASVGGREVSRQQAPELFDTVERLCRKGNLPMPRVCVSPAAAPNAFATGRGPAHAAVCVTAGLLEMLSPDELEGVLAHELGHVKSRDVLISTIASVIGGAISVLAYFAFFFGGDNRRGNPLVGLALMIFAPMAAGLIRMAISRSREYEADRYAAELTGRPRGLANALRKLANGNRRIPMPVPESQSNMFIVHPLTRRGEGMSKLFMTHPPIEQRIARLEAMNRGQL